MTEMSTTRGLPFEPAAASEMRVVTRARAEAQARREADQRRRERREYGRMLDQIETCYRQHHVPQSERWH